MERRVVITSEAAITPIGRAKDEIFDNLANGVSGVKKLREDDLLADFIHSRVYGTVDYEIDYNFERQYSKTMGPVSYYACQVAREALGRAGLDSDFVSSGRLGVAFGSTHGSPSIQRNIYRTFFEGLPSEKRSIGAADYLKSMVHTTAVNITKMFGITGRVISSCTACTTSSQSIGYGYEAIKFGLQDAMLCGGSDEYDTTTVAVFDNLLACSTKFNDSPSRTPRPFDAERDGLVVGEGAGALMLEEYDFAKKRGAPILAEVIGFACCNNGGDLILPNEKGIRQVINTALENASINAEDVDFISAHSTATRMGDVIEAQAIHAYYKDDPYVIGLKSYIGHSMGSCGVIETIFSLYMMEHGLIVPTLNLENVDERCGMIRHAMKLHESDTNIAAIQSFAFGGVNTCLLIKKFE